MEIEIITTKKKITLSILKQMYQLSYSKFDSVEILGFVSVGRKNTNKSALCKYSNDYYLLNLNWEKRGTYAGYNLYGRRGEHILRLDPDIIEDWFEKYESIKRLAEKMGHIYI